MYLERLDTAAGLSTACCRLPPPNGVDTRRSVKSRHHATSALKLNQPFWRYAAVEVRLGARYHSSPPVSSRCRTAASGASDTTIANTSALDTTNFSCAYCQPGISCHLSRPSRSYAPLRGVLNNAPSMTGYVTLLWDSAGVISTRRVNGRVFRHGHNKCEEVSHMIYAE